MLVNLYILFFSMKFQLSLKKSNFNKDKRKNAPLITDQIKDTLLVYLLWKSNKIAMWLLNSMRNFLYDVVSKWLTYAVIQSS